MVGLLSLPEGLLTVIYVLAGQQTRALVRLSRVNRRLRSIWLNDADHIIHSAFRIEAPDHEDAIQLILMETRLPKPITGFHHCNPS